MNFWKVVIDELEFQNKTRKWLAAEASFDVSTIGTGLKRESIPQVDLALRIAKALNVPVEYLVTGNLKKKNSESSLPTDFQNYTEKMSKLTPSKRKIIFELIDSLIEEK